MGVGVGFLSGVHLKTRGLLLLYLFVIVGTPAWATSQQPRELAERASCFVCKQGQYSFECNPQEIDCPGGYCDSVCPDCPPGTCAPLIETINCTVCSAGYYTDDYGTTNCSACNAGSYSKSPGSSGCENCSPGQYSGYASSNCSICPSGTWSAGGSSSCTNCSAGTYSTAGASDCSSCLPGTFSEGAASNCTSCPPGSYQPNEKGTGCGLCDAGSYAPNYTSSSCIKCPAGWYQNYPGTTGCLECDADTFSDEGSSDCKICAPLYTSSPGSENCRPSWELWLVVMSALVCVVVILLAVWRLVVYRRRQLSHIHLLEIEKVIPSPADGPVYTGN
ncbi:GCC2 and GCC3 [Pelomyxa schiedti]|nr:GCC2 and GCC3 [Pelomyxa schiedti]